MVGTRSVGQAAVEIILDGKDFQFPLHHTKQVKPKYRAGAIPALLFEGLRRDPGTSPVMMRSLHLSKER